MIHCVGPSSGRKAVALSHRQWYQNHAAQNKRLAATSDPAAQLSLRPCINSFECGTWLPRPQFQCARCLVAPIPVYAEAGRSAAKEFWSSRCDQKMSRDMARLESEKSTGTMRAI